MNIRSYFNENKSISIFFVIIFSIINIYMISLNSIKDNIGDLIYLDVLILIIYVITIILDYKRWKNKYGDLYEIAAEEGEITEDDVKTDEVSDLILKYVLEHYKDNYLKQVKDKEDSLKDIEEYITRWVHEIKLPISSINILIDSIEDEELAGKIKEENEKINFLVNSVMYGSRSTASAEDLFIKEESLKDMIKKCVKNNAFLLIKNNIEIEMDNVDFIVYTDEKWILYILDQLVNNSIKYMNSVSHKKLKFHAEEDKNCIKFYVEDNGIGIAKEDLGRVFDKGFTGSNGRSQVYKSTGMGLYFSKKIIDKLGHSIEVQSVKSEYTTFIITFYNISDYLKAAK